MNALTKLLGTVNLAGALIALALLASTWFGKGVILGIARDKALDSARPKLEAVAGAVEKLTGNRKLMALLPDPARERLEREMASYQADPDGWMIGIAGEVREKAGSLDLPEVKNPLAKAGVDFLKKKAVEARDRFQQSLDALLRDLRIFAGTNAIVCLIAATFCFLSKKPWAQRRACIWSSVLLLGTFASVMVYLDQPWSWNILTNRHFGWTYPAVHGAITIYMIVKLQAWRSEFPEKSRRWE